MRGTKAYNVLLSDHVNCGATLFSSKTQKIFSIPFATSKHAIASSAVLRGVSLAMTPQSANANLAMLWRKGSALLLDSKLCDKTRFASMRARELIGQMTRNRASEGMMGQGTDSAEYNHVPQHYLKILKSMRLMP